MFEVPLEFAFVVWWHLCQTSSMSILPTSQSLAGDKQTATLPKQLSSLFGLPFQTLSDRLAFYFETPYHPCTRLAWQLEPIQATNSSSLRFFSLTGMPEQHASLTDLDRVPAFGSNTVPTP